jgi:hypothetical protein
MSINEWLSDIRARHPIPELPAPAPVDPAFWEFRGVLALREAAWGSLRWLSDGSANQA